MKQDIIPYQKIVTALKKQKKGSTYADISSATALSLPEVKRLLPKAADEFSGHLQVTASGEVLYTFPNGFTSRYKGAGVSIKKAIYFLSDIIKKLSVFLFKVWIMVMLVGYFVLFLLIALAAVVLTVAAQSKSSNNNRRTSTYFGPNLFGLIWRIWFINAMMGNRRGYQTSFPSAKKKDDKYPMHKAIFSFVFGEEDPNKNFQETEDKAIIAFIQANRGVISLPEYMAFSGKNSIESEEKILSFCFRFGGSPEVTEEGTIVYFFEELLMGAGASGGAEITAPIKRLKEFSFNSKKINTWFIVINAVNLFFGSYFLYHSLNTGPLETELQYQSASYLYAFTHIFADFFTGNPVSVLLVFLGLVPFVFSILFWLIPILRKISETKENEETKIENYKKQMFAKIWKAPEKVEVLKLIPTGNDSRPKNQLQAADRVVKDIGVIFPPDIEINEEGATVYSFNELKNEKQVLDKYRQNINLENYKLGKTVFDSFV